MPQDPDNRGSQFADPLEFIDRLDPVEIRERLAENVRQAEALRKLLRLAKQTEGARQDRQGGRGQA